MNLVVFRRTFYIQLRSELTRVWCHIYRVWRWLRIMTWTTQVARSFCIVFALNHCSRSLGEVDYIVLYGLLGQTGETAFRFASAPILSAPSFVSSDFSNGILTISYPLSNGSQFITIQHDQSTVVVIVLDKFTANTWHAPVIAGEGDFGQFFSIGTNQRLATSWMLSLVYLNCFLSVLVAGPYVVRTAEITRNTLMLVSR